jgi:serine/threonine protein kinase
MTEPADGLVLGSTVERYRIDGVLGEGGMARVYRVTHTILGTTHALKVLTLPGRQFRARLVQEGRAQASLRHPNVVGVTDVLELPGCVGLVLEYVPGGTLEELICRRSLSVSQIDHLADGVLRGVAFAHERGLVHRDLKPANVLLQVEGRRVTPKVADFGLVKSLGSDEGATRSGVMMGTPRFMAPEQVESARDVDHRADVFALGAILYAMVTGKNAFAPDSGVLLKIVAAVQSGTYVPVRALRPDAPDRWVDAIGAALQVDAALRPATAEDLRLRFLGREAGSEEGAFGLVVGAEVTESPDPESQTLAPPPASASPPTVTPTATPTATQGPPRSPRLGPAAAVIGGLVGTSALAVASLLSLLAVPALRAVAPDPAPARAAARPEVAAPDPVPPATAATPAPDPVVAAPSPAPPPAASPRPRVPPAPAARPGPAPAPPVEPAPAPVDPTTAAVAPAPTTPPEASFRIDGARGYLRCAGVDHVPGPVPPGTCAVHAFFGDDPVTVRRDLVVPAGATVAVTCRPAFRLCDVEVR